MPVRRVLFLGDICSEAGREAVKRVLPELKSAQGVDFVVANAENAAGGYGITPRLAEELLAAGIDCLTMGDHAFERRESWEYYQSQPRLLRPLNFPLAAPGRGEACFEVADTKLAVVNLQGRVFMKPLDCPFQKVESVLDRLRSEAKIIIVDFHAEATAEKQAMGRFLDGRVSAVLGTHTHVQTADEQILPQGTAYISDVGMCGAFDSVLGMRIEGAMVRLRHQLPARLEPARGLPRVNGVVVEVYQDTGKACSIWRVNLPA